MDLRWEHSENTSLGVFENLTNKEVGGVVKVLTLSIYS